MSSTHLDTDSLRVKFGLKIQELINVFKIQCDLEDKKDFAVQKEIEDLKSELIEKEKSLRRFEKISKELQESKEKCSKLQNELDNRDLEIQILNEELIEKNRQIKIDIEERKNADRRIENMRIELSGYLTKLNDTKKKLQESESETDQYYGMYNRVNKMFKKANDDLDYLKEDFECRNSVQEEFIQTLLTILKKNGITEFDCDALESETPVNEIDEEDFEEEVRPPLKSYPWWRPAKDMTTILEEDESICEADDEGDKPIDSAFESDPQASSDIKNDTDVVITIEEINKLNKTETSIQCDLDAEEIHPTSSFVNSIPSETSIVNMTDGEKPIKKRSKTRSRKKKNCDVKPVTSEEKIKIKRHYSKVMTIGCY